MKTGKNRIDHLSPEQLARISATQESQIPRGSRTSEEQTLAEDFVEYMIKKGKVDKEDRAEYRDILAAGSRIRTLLRDTEVFTARHRAKRCAPFRR